jgi:hypothetical protein
MKTLALLVSSALMFMNVESHWIQLDGKLKQLDVDGSRICGVSCSNDLFCKPIINANWELH